MMEDLLAKFLPQFLAHTRTRVATAINATAQRDRAAVSKTISELHTVAGEAGLLGLTDVFPLVRDCEMKAKRLRDTGADPDVEVLLAALHHLAQVIEGLAAAPGRSQQDRPTTAR
jgi:HPt (histidine-containing phosphotransfer) domain-containing protein